ncbi:cytochrome P450 61 [Cladorrhinum sp. PSN259]|nr:cytochrome P450 61 [Cladorrhinum sp. PSN259]
MAINATAFASPLASVGIGAVNVNVPPQLEQVVELVSKASGWAIFLTLLAAAVVYDQVSYILNKGTIEGPAMKMPFIGPFLQSVNPKFEEYYGKWLSGPLSCVSVFHKFVVIASTRDMARKVFNSPTFVKPCVVDVAHKLLGKDNWVFLDGKAHVDYRKGLNGLFTRRALEIYLPGQEEVYNRYIEKFVQITKEAGGQPVPWMQVFREVITAVSCRTFVGHYLSDEAVKKIADDYYLITEALELVNFPIIIPFTKTWRGKKASDMVLAEFSKCAAKSKVRMNAGGEPNCIMDAWVLDMIKSKKWREAVEAGKTEGVEKPTHILREFTDYEIAQTLFTFLFASQDATSSAATWLFQIMAQRPEILDRIREENLTVRRGNPDHAVNLEELESMAYTRAVIRELLRYRPPVLMVPYLTKKPFPITDTYTVPKGAMVIPSTYLALRDPDVYENPDVFDPERYYTGDAEEKGAKNYLVFGTGPHYCLGQHYAQMNLVLFIGKASLKLDWKHHPTPLSEEIKVFATIFPKVNKMASRRALAGLAQTCCSSARSTFTSPSSTKLRAIATTTTARLALRQSTQQRAFVTRATVTRQYAPALVKKTAYSSESAAPPGEEKPSKIWNFEEVDSREPSELQETGRIPGAINIPVKSAPDSFFIPEDEFEDHYGFPRPSKDTEVLFYCRAGVRSRAAAELAKHAGWTNVGEYPGSWLDWFEKGGKIER